MLIRRFVTVFILLSILALSFLLPACSRSAPRPTMDTSVGSLQVYVSDSSASPLQGASVVSQVQPEGQLKVDGLTQSDGLVSFTGIKPGSYEFAVSQPGSTPKVAAVNLAPGQPVSISISLEKATP